MRKIFSLIALLAIVAALFATATPTAAQDSAPTVTDYGQLPTKGQLVIPAGKGWVAPDSWNGLNVTVWYGTADDTNTTMANLGNGIATDRSQKYGGQPSDYPTVVWGGPSVHVGGQCRGQFYSDATVLTAGVVYGDECPVLIEYNAEGHFIAQPATQPGPAATPQPTPPAIEAPPTDGGGFDWASLYAGCVWLLVIVALGLFAWAAIRWWRRRHPPAL